jgi:hypothetical protein
LGWFAVGAGVFLAGMMGWLTAWFAWVLWEQERNPHPSTRFDGGPGTAALIMGLFVFLFLFGVAIIRGGVLQIRHGQRDTRMLAWIPAVLMVVFAFLVLAEIVDLVMGG